MIAMQLHGVNFTMFGPSLAMGVLESMVQCIINLETQFCVCKYRAFNHGLMGGEA